MRGSGNGASGVPAGIGLDFRRKGRASGANPRGPRATRGRASHLSQDTVSVVRQGGSRAGPSCANSDRSGAPTWRRLNEIRGRRSGSANNDGFRPWWCFPYRGPTRVLAAWLFPNFNSDDDEGCAAADPAFGQAQSIGVAELRTGAHVRSGYGLKHAGISFPGDQARSGCRSETVFPRKKRKLYKLRPSPVRKVEYLMRSTDPGTTKHERKLAAFSANEMDRQLLDVVFVTAT